MLLKVNLWCLIVSYILVICSADNSDENEIARGITAKSLLEKITSSFMTRSGDGSSQVLSLNLSNLLILVLLKALIFAAGSMGSGGGGFKFNQGGYGRSSEGQDNHFMSDTEVLLYLGYLSGSQGNYTCLQNIACHRPQQAMQYAKAGGLLVRAARIVPNIVDVDPDHEKTVIDLRKAAEFGQTGGDCDAQFGCSN